MLGKSLLSRNINENEKIERILSFLCSESGSHDYTIYRDEARDELGLNIEQPNENLYDLLRKIYNDISSELELTIPYNPIISLAGKNEIDYNFVRAMLESNQGGSHKFVSQGILRKQQIPDPNGNMQTSIKDDRSFEGWRYDNV